MIVISLKVVLLCVLLLFLGLISAVVILSPRWGRAGMRRGFWNTDTMLDAMPLGTLIFEHGRLRQANAVAHNLLHHHPDIESVISQLSLDIAAQAIVRSGTFTSPYPLRWWGALLDDQQTLLVLLDVRDQHALMARQHTFIGQLSHELRTPLTALTAHAEIALREQENSEVLQTSLRIIQHETQRSARLVRDLVELYRLEVSGQLSMRKANLVLVAEAAIAQVIIHAEQKGQHLRFNADVSLPLVWIDPDRMTQVFVNLLQNAVAHTSPGDSIVVSLIQHDDAIVCEIADTGPGIADADLPHVAEPLYRGQTKSEGSGLGLALVTEILRQHATTLNIISTTTGPQTGTVCRWTLDPLRAALPPQSHTTSMEIAA